MYRIWILSFLFIGFGYFQSCGNPEAETQSDAAEEHPVEVQLVWADEFDEGGLPDTTKWSYDVGDGCPNLCGWGNNELQYYTERRPANARIEDGHLIIEARREDFETREYTSARLVTREKGDWLYGRIEVRAKLPSGLGTWPAIWMLPTEWSYGGWPQSGEIDIMEHVGYEPDSIYGTVHTETYNHMLGTQRSGQIYVADCEEVFHVYAVDWHPKGIDFIIDKQIYQSFPNEGTGFKAWPFNQPFHLILNIAVGGNWGGKEGVAENIWPQQMVVDYVRVYQRVEVH